jgi:peroxiredoxin
MSNYNVTFRFQDDYLKSLKNAEACVGQIAPDFELKDVNGQLVRLSDYRNKAHIVMVFGSTT